MQSLRMERNSGGSRYPERTHPSDKGDSGELNLGQLWEQQLFCQDRVICYSFSDQLSKHPRVNLCCLAAFCILKQIYKLSCRRGDCLLIPLILSSSFLAESPFVLISTFLSYPSTTLLAFPLCDCIPQSRVSIFMYCLHSARDSSFPHNLSLFSFFSVHAPFFFSLNLVWKNSSPFSNVTALCHPLFKGGCYSLPADFLPRVK